MVRQFPSSSSSSSSREDGVRRLSRASSSSSSSRSASGANNGRKNGTATTSAAATMPLPQFARSVPLRLSPEERALLNVLEQTLHVSEYTDHVDVTSARRGIKSKRVLDGIMEACHVATGLAVASGHEGSLLHAAGTGGAADGSSRSSNGGPRRPFKKDGKSGKNRPGSSQEDDKDDAPPSTSSSHLNGTKNGKSSWASKDPRENAALFQAMFEVGRRNKVLNPSSMRTTYGKLMVSNLHRV